MRHGHFLVLIRQHGERLRGQMREGIVVDIRQVGDVRIVAVAEDQCLAIFLAQPLQLGNGDQRLAGGLVGAAQGFQLLKQRQLAAGEEHPVVAVAADGVRVLGVLAAQLVHGLHDQEEANVAAAGGGDHRVHVRDGGQVGEFVQQEVHADGQRAALPALGSVDEGLVALLDHQADDAVQRRLFVRHDQVERGLPRADGREVDARRGEYPHQRILGVEDLHRRVVGDHDVHEGLFRARDDAVQVAARDGAAGVEFGHLVGEALCLAAVRTRQTFGEPPQSGEVAKVLREGAVVLHDHAAQAREHGGRRLLPEGVGLGVRMLRKQRGGQIVYEGDGALLFTAGIVVLRGDDWVPAVAAQRVAQVDDHDAIALLGKQSAGALVELALRVGADHALAGLGDDVHHRHGKQARLLGAGGAQDQRMGIAVVYEGGAAVADQRDAAGVVVAVHQPNL